MATEVSPVSNCAVIERDTLGDLIQSLAGRGYQVIGPTLRENAIVYERLISHEDLPAGWTDEQDGGVYRLKRRNDAALFGYNVGPHSWKKFLLPPVQRLWEARREAGAFQILSEKVEVPKYAFLGVRAGELHAIAIQDKVFFGGAYADPGYKSRRENLFLIAVNCGQAGGTCVGNAYDFCKDLFNIVYACLGGRADLYLLSQK